MVATAIAATLTAATTALDFAVVVGAFVVEVDEVLVAAEDELAPEAPGDVVVGAAMTVAELLVELLPAVEFLLGDVARPKRSLRVHLNVAVLSTEPSFNGLGKSHAGLTALTFLTTPSQYDTRWSRQDSLQVRFSVLRVGGERDSSVFGTCDSVCAGGGVEEDCSHVQTTSSGFSCCGNSSQGDDGDSLHSEGSW
ncbi:unnamed protein product [Aphanomyces euteiches]